MTHKKSSLRILFSLLVAVLAVFTNGSFLASPIPVTDGPLPLSADPSTTATLPALTSFIPTVTNGQAGVLTGIYMDGITALPVVQQPAANAAFVSTTAGVATQFALASQYQTTGLLAHNFLAGADFFKVQTGQLITLVYGDGSTARYQVQLVEKYQALSPNSIYSRFANLNDLTQPQLTSTDLFNHIYAPGGRLVLQTCIEANGEPSWGRLFVIAMPVVETTAAYHTNPMADYTWEDFSN